MIKYSTTSTNNLQINLQVMQTATDRRFALLILAILSTSLYIFNTELVIGPFASQLLHCISQTHPGSGELTIVQLAFTCSWTPYTWIVAGSLLSILLVFGAAVVIYWIRPRFILHTNHLTPLGNDLKGVSDALDTLRSIAHIPSSLRLHYVYDPLSTEPPRVFSGLGKHYFVVTNSLIRQFTSKNENDFQSIALHEFAHLYSKDATKSDFALSIAYSFTCIALAPFLGILLWSLFHLGSNPVAGREFVLLHFLDLLPLVSLIYFTYTSVWRSREVYADMQARHWRGETSIRKLILGTSTQIPRPLPLWKRVFMLHLGIYERIQAIENEQLAFRLNFWEAFGLGIILATALPPFHDFFNLISQLLITSLFKVNYPLGFPDLGTLAFCLFIAPIIGQMIWRARLVSLLNGKELTGTARFGLCLAAGIAMGFFLSFYATFLLYYLSSWLVLLTYSIPLLLLLLIGMAVFCKWQVLTATIWLNVVDSSKMLRRVSRSSFLVSGGLLTIGMTLYGLFVILVFGALVSQNTTLPQLLHPVASSSSFAEYFTWQKILQFFVVVFSGFSTLMAILAVLWMFPLIAWFRYHKGVPQQQYQWARPTAANMPSPDVSPVAFSLQRVTWYAVVGSMLFCGTLFILHQWSIHVPILAHFQTTPPYSTLFTLAQLAFAALFQTILAAILLLSIRSTGLVTGLLGSILSGCMMGIGYYDIYHIFSSPLVGPMAPRGFDNVFFIVVNWGTIGAFIALILLGLCIPFHTANRLKSSTLSVLPEQRKTPINQHRNRRWQLPVSILWVLLLVVAVFYPAHSTANATIQSGYSMGIVKNGDFEMPKVQSAVIEYNKGQNFQGWIVESGSVDLTSNAYWQAAHGSQSLDLSGSDEGIIYQDIATTPNQNYVLSFQFAGNPVCPPTIKQMQVWWGTFRVDTLSFDITNHTQSKLGWKLHSYTVKATGSKMRMRFVSLTHGACGPALDAVSVQEGSS